MTDKYQTVTYHTETGAETRGGDQGFTTMGQIRVAILELFSSGVADYFLVYPYQGILHLQWLHSDPQDPESVHPGPGQFWYEAEGFGGDYLTPEELCRR